MWEHNYLQLTNTKLPHSEDETTPFSARGRKSHRQPVVMTVLGCDEAASESVEILLWLWCSWRWGEWEWLCGQRDLEQSASHQCDDDQNNLRSDGYQCKGSGHNKTGQSEEQEGSDQSPEHNRFGHSLPRDASRHLEVQRVSGKSIDKQDCSDLLGDSKCSSRQHGSAWSCVTLSSRDKHSLAQRNGDLLKNSTVQSGQLPR